MPNARPQRDRLQEGGRCFNVRPQRDRLQEGGRCLMPGLSGTGYRRAEDALEHFQKCRSRTPRVGVSPFRNRPHRDRLQESGRCFNVRPHRDRLQKT